MRLDPWLRQDWIAAQQVSPPGRAAPGSHTADPLRFSRPPQQMPGLNELTSQRASAPVKYQAMQTAAPAAVRQSDVGVPVQADSATQPSADAASGQAALIPTVPVADNARLQEPASAAAPQAQGKSSRRQAAGSRQPQQSSRWQSLCSRRRYIPVQTRCSSRSLFCRRRASRMKMRLEPWPGHGR